MLLWCSFPLGLQSCSNIISAEVINFKNRLIERLYTDNEFYGGISFYIVSSFKSTTHKTNLNQNNWFFLLLLYFPELLLVWLWGHVSTWASVQGLVAYLLKASELTCTVALMHCGVTATDSAGGLRSTSTVIFIQAVSIKHEDYRGMSSKLVKAG